MHAKRYMIANETIKSKPIRLLVGQITMVHLYCFAVAVAVNEVVDDSHVELNVAE